VDQTISGEVQDSPSLLSHAGAKHAHWKRHVEAWQGSGLSQRAYAQQHNLVFTRFVYWKNKLQPNHRVSRKSFAAVKLDPVQSSMPVRLILPTGLIIECQAGTDVVWLRSLMGLSHAS